MGGARTAVSGDPDGVFGNPAGLAGQDGVVVNGSVFRPFGLPALQSQVFTVAGKLGRGAGYAGVSFFGKKNYYREGVYAAGYAYPVLPRLRAALTVKYMTLEILPLYGSDWCAGVDAGVQYRVVRGVTLGASAVNINAPSIGTAAEYISRSLCLGAAFRPHPGVLVAVDAVREAPHPVQLHAGQEIRLFRCLLLRTGLMTGPARFTVGGGIDLGWLSFDYAFAGHYDLGGSHQIRMYLRYPLPGQAPE